MARRVIGLLLVVAFSYLGWAKEVPPKPEGHDRFINDYARVLSPDQIRNLNLKLYNYWDSTSTEMVVVIDKSLEDDDLEDYCQKLAQAWGIGMKGKDNGLLLYVSIEDRAIRIHMGYGLEGAIPDFMAGRVIDGIIKPAFKQNLYGKGINEGLNALIALAEGEYQFDEKDRKAKSKGFPTLLIIVIMEKLTMAVVDHLWVEQDGAVIQAVEALEAAAVLVEALEEVLLVVVVQAETGNNYA